MLTAKEAREIRDSSLKPLKGIENAIRYESEQGRSCLQYSDVPPAVSNLLKQNGYKVTSFESHCVIEW